jgi:transglutaminase/protease-like cytokinesis protein 3
MANIKRTDNTMANIKRTDNTMANIKRTDNTMANIKRTDNTMANIKRTNQATRTPLKPRVELICPGRVSNSCSTSNTCRVALR